MYTEWTSHLPDPEDKKEFEKAVLRSRHVLERLSTILSMKEHSIQIHETGLKQFESPAWDYKQAFINGHKAIIQYIKTLIDQKETKNNDRYSRRDKPANN